MTRCKIIHNATNKELAQDGLTPIMSLMLQKILRALEFMWMQKQRTDICLMLSLLYETGCVNLMNKTINCIKINDIFGNKKHCGIRVHKSMKKIADMVMHAKVNVTMDIESFFSIEIDKNFYETKRNEPSAMLNPFLGELIFNFV